jgi:hypothetical protein
LSGAVFDFSPEEAIRVKARNAATTAKRITLFLMMTLLLNDPLVEETECRSPCTYLPEA